MVYSDGEQYEDASPHPSNNNNSRTTPRASEYARRIGQSPYERILAEAYPEKKRRPSSASDSSVNVSRRSSATPRGNTPRSSRGGNTSRRSSYSQSHNRSHLFASEDDKPRTIAASPYRGPYKNKKPDYWRTSYFLPQNSKAGTFGTAKRFQGNFVGGKDINKTKEIPGPGQYGKSTDRKFTYDKQRPINPRGKTRSERVAVYEADKSHGVSFNRTRRFPRNYVAGQDVSHALDKPGVGMYSPYYAALTKGRN